LKPFQNSKERTSDAKKRSSKVYIGDVEDKLYTFKATLAALVGINEALVLTELHHMEVKAHGTDLAPA
jgi:hypothetical protein